MKNIEYLAQYLPYKLKLKRDIVRIDSENQSDIITMLGIHDGGNLWISEDYKGMGYNAEFCKPILRPLSDFIREIKPNEKVFTPSFIISRDFKDAEDYILAFIECISYDLDQLKDMVKYMPNCIREKLLEWHFDMDGLIEKGLSIDINTLK